MQTVRQAAHFFLQNEQMDPSLDWVEVYALDEQSLRSTLQSAF